MEGKKCNNRVIHIDLLKFIAALMITNSHLYDFYPPNLSALGTFGALGNGLFFFASGYLLNLGRLNDFGYWYKRRISRLWPSIIAWCTLVSPLIFNSDIDWASIWTGQGLWFVRCIVVYYLIFYVTIKYLSKYIVHICALTALFCMIIFFFLPWDARAIYTTDFHYLCFFSIMLLGSIAANNKKKNKTITLSRNLLTAFVSILLFYGIQYLGKGKESGIYYMQILSYIPLFSLIYSINNICAYPLFENLVSHRNVGAVIRFVSNLTLEIYIVGFTVFMIPNKMINIFPLNLLVIFAMILALAYMTKVISIFIIQTFALERYDWKKMFVII